MLMPPLPLLGGRWTCIVLNLLVGLCRPKGYVGASKSAASRVADDDDDDDENDSDDSLSGLLSDDASSGNEDIVVPTKLGMLARCAIPDLNGDCCA